MNEQGMWAHIRPKLTIAGLDPVRVENSAMPGTPDVWYTHGAVELKYAERWPPRGGPLRIEHYTAEQRVWLYRRARAGGRAFLLLRVGLKKWYLFRAGEATDYLYTNGMTRDEAGARAVVWSDDGFPLDSMVAALVV